MKKLLYFIASAISMFLLFSKNSYADDFTNEWLNEWKSSIQGDGGGSTVTIDRGALNSQQGWIIYIIDGQGNLVTDSKCCVKSGGYVSADACNYKEIEPRYGGSGGNISIGYEWPDATVGGNFSSNYVAVKSYMISNKGEGIFNTIKTYFGSSAVEMFKSDNDYYFVMEPVYWHGLHKKVEGGSKVISGEQHYNQWVWEKYSVIYDFQNWWPTHEKEIVKRLESLGKYNAKWKDYIDWLTNMYLFQHPYDHSWDIVSKGGFEWTGEYFLGTEYRGALWALAQNYDYFCAVDICRRNYWANNIKYSKDIAGVPAGSGSGYIGDTNITHAGYGICAFHNKEIENPPEEYKPDNHYKTRNWSDSFDISMAIPSSEDVNNEIDCSSLIAEENFFNEKEEKWDDKYSTTIKYFWEETIITVIPESWEYYSTYPTLELANIGLSEIDGKVEFEDGVYNVYKRVPEHEESETIKHYINDRSYKFNCLLKYQYISDRPQIYFWDNTQIGNGAFPDNFGEHTIYYDKDNVLTYPEAFVKERLWNMGNGTATVVDTALNETDAGVIYKESKDHFIWMPGNVTYMGDECVKSVTHYATEACPYDNSKAEKDTDTLEKSVTQKYATQIQKGTKSRNDYLKITAPLIGSIELVTDDWYYGCTVKVIRGGNEIATFSKKDASAYGYKKNGLLYKITNNFLSARIKGLQTNTIPDDTDNGDYPTGMNVNYHYILMPSEIGKQYYAGKEYYRDSGIGSEIEEIYDHIIEGGILSHHTPGDGYPIRVHTPVESPVRVTYYDGTTAYETTQLVVSAFNTSAAHQLLLDKKYFVEWDDTRWISAIYGECEGYESIYNKYVKAKFLKFPMSIVYEGQLYEVGEDGYTEWIEVKKPDDVMTGYQQDVDWKHYESANHWQMTPFYIPSYSEERGAWGDNAYIMCKVYAINVSGRYAGDHEGQEEHIINSDKENYVAIYDTTVQISGWLYDFTITGADNRFIYTGEKLKDLDNNWYAMCPDHQELKSGLLNRVGGKWIRWLENGGIWNKLEERQTVPLRNGYSYSMAHMGDLWRAERFAFTIKTISDLDGENDSLEITPSYKYVTADGDVLRSEDGDFCYVQLSDNGCQWYVYNSKDTLRGVADKYINEYQLIDPLFRSSYYDETAESYHFGDWVTTSVENENTYNPLGVTNQQYQRRTLKNYTISHISLDCKARYISGEYEQLEDNLNKQFEEVEPYNFVGNNEDKVIHSMQQWNGEFKIPSHIRLVDTRDYDNFDFDEWIKDLGQWSWNDYDTFMEFEPNSKMVIHFDIIAYKDGKPYLQYDGSGFGGKNMWEEEGFTPEPDDPDPDAPYVPIEPGDVVVVDWMRSIGDYYESAIFNIN